MTEIQDWQFGRMYLDKDLGWCSEELEWTQGKTVALYINTELNEYGSIPDYARKIFGSIKKEESAFKERAARNLLDAFNSIFNDDEEDSEENDVEDLINRMMLSSVHINTDRSSELCYETGGYPLIRIFISPDYSFKEAFLD